MLPLFDAETMAALTEGEERPDPTLEEEFESYLLDNPSTYDWVVAAARRDKLAGRRSGSIMDYIYRFRRIGPDATDTPAGAPGVRYKIRNAFAPLLSRKIMAENPDLDGYFRTAKRRRKRKP